jgi:pimeloyl-ACP methyl ester carboxylesterase
MVPPVRETPGIAGSGLLVGHTVRPPKSSMAFQSGTDFGPIWPIFSISSPTGSSPSTSGGAAPGASSPTVASAFTPNCRPLLIDSPVHHLDRFETPLLILHGTDDPVVGFEQAGEMFVGLSDLGQDVTLLAYRGEGHIPSRFRDANRAHMTRHPSGTRRASREPWPPPDIPKWGQRFRSAA